MTIFLHHRQHRKIQRLILSFLLLVLVLSVQNPVRAGLDTIGNPGNDLVRANAPNAPHSDFHISTQVDPTKIDPDRIETFSVKSPQLDGREKDIIVHFPSHYTTSGKNYPVIYLQKAEDVFIFDNIDNSWSLDEDQFLFFTSALEDAAIIIGIKSDPVYYWEEFNPWVNENMNLWMDPFDANRIEGGKGETYLDFLINTLKPEIDNRYRTLTDRENTSIGGSDVGGLFSLYAGLTRPEVFSRVLSLSPAVWAAEEGGTWLSNNRLIELINTSSAPKNVVFIIDYDLAESLEEIIIRPVVNDTQGEKISFVQAYTEGSEAVVRALLKNGVPISNIKSGIDDPDKWQSEKEFSVLGARNGLQISYIPVFLTPKFPPEFTSAAGTSFFIGHNNEFIIEAIGGPTPTITYANALPMGVNFVDNGDGTATLSGIPTGPSGIYTLYITAENGITPPATQYFKLRITDQPVCNDDTGCFFEFDMSMNPYLNRTRTIHIYIPPHYDHDGGGYQVIYLTSAENLFGTEIGAYTSNDWDFDETLDALYDQTGIGTIAVGLEYDSHYQWDEYSIWNNNNMDNWVTDVTYFTGKGTSYLNFIVNTLKPIIDSSYNTLPDSENTAFGGGSRNAFLALCAGLTHPETFSKVMSFSPAVWLGEGGGKLPLGQPVWFSTNQLGIWLDSHNVPSDVEFFLHTGRNEWQGTGGAYPYAYTSSGTKLEWEDVYYTGAKKIKSKLGLSGLNYHETSGSHTPSHWKQYVDDALWVLGFYPEVLTDN